jgi:ubiquinone/menaquinone biosynthesis C-methylase UbiE
MTGIMDPAVLTRMREEWEERARENARHYVQNAEQSWEDREFFRSGEINVANEVMPEMVRICGGSRSPLDLSMLEIGCGVGRMTRMLARLFAQVTALDVSPSMVEQAKANLRGFPNAQVILGDGATLHQIPDASIDFAFSFIVFQHIPNREVIESYCREVHRVLRPGSLFKFQVQGGLPDRTDEPDTWHGVSFTPEQAEDLCAKTGFQLELSMGAGTQYFWLWFRKQQES